jgi:phosphate transport system ATP-binding protein
MPLLQTPMPPPLTVTVRPKSTPTPEHPVSIEVQGLNFYYGAKRALENISISIQRNLVTAFIGPSGCGKSTFLRTLNRMNDIIAGTRVEGQVLIDGDDVYKAGPTSWLCAAGSAWCSRSRTRSPESIFENVAYGVRLNGLASNRSEMHGRVEESLKAAAIWDEVKDRLHESALAPRRVSRQRLCIARSPGGEAGNPVDGRARLRLWIRSRRSASRS